MGSGDPSLKEPSKEESMTWPMVVASVFGVLFCLYMFLCGLSLMGSGFKVIGGRGASNMFSAVDNPIVGVMTGVLSTVLVQSSSTSTSIVVAMVGADQLSVHNGIPIVMGANIGTSVTNTIVSMGQSGNRIDLERAFSGATVHDMFNMLTVVTLLPIETICRAIQGEGGPLYWLTLSITERLVDEGKSEDLFKSPIKAITDPIVDAVLSVNKHVIYALTLDKPQRWVQCDNNSVDCSAYYCVNQALDNDFKKISKSQYERLQNCDGLILDHECGEDECYLDAGSFYAENVEGGRLIKGGLLKALGDVGGSIAALVLSLLLLGGGLIGLCKALQKIFMGKARAVIRYATKLNDYLAIVIGMGITIVVQSSSVVTSSLTPLCGLGVLPLSKMLPLSCGANVGTCCTALLASLVSLKFAAVQIALCHFFFNVFGIMIWFVIPPMRQVPLGAAKLLGLYASFYRLFPALYIFVAFVTVPGVSLLISMVFNVNVFGGIALLLTTLCILGVFEFWWLIGYPIGNPGCFKVLSKEDRERGEAELKIANEAIMRGDQKSIAVVVEH